MGSNKLFPFSTVVFASWDYHLTDAGAARNLRHSIRNQLKEMVNDALLEDKIVDTRTKVKGYVKKVTLQHVDPQVAALPSLNEGALSLQEGHQGGASHSGWVAPELGRPANSLCTSLHALCG